MSVCDLRASASLLLFVPNASVSVRPRSLLDEKPSAAQGHLSIFPCWSQSPLNQHWTLSLALDPGPPARRRAVRVKETQEKADATQGDRAIN